MDAWPLRESLGWRDVGDDGGLVGRERSYLGERISNATHVSRTGPQAELMRKCKGKKMRLRCGLHHGVKNCHHLIGGVMTAPAAGSAAR